MYWLAEMFLFFFTIIFSLGLFNYNNRGPGRPSVDLSARPQADSLLHIPVAIPCKCVITAALTCPHLLCTTLQSPLPPPQQL